MDVTLSWYIARAGGLTAWLLIASAVLWGLILSTRITNGRPSAGWTLDLHRFLGALSLLFTGVHLAGLMLDSYLHFGLTQILVPMTSRYRPLAVTWGVIALYLLVAVQLTSWLRGHLPLRLWRVIHLTTVPLFVLSTVHLFAAGSEAGLGAVQWVALLWCAACFFLLVYRLTMPRGRSRPAAARKLQIRRVRDEADGVVSLTLVDPSGAALPAWEPGAHIDLILPSGTVRQYSLCGDPADRSAYRIGVLRVADGRGGSAEVHRLRAGKLVGIRGPRNNFPFVDAPSYLFLAGGIGVTPLLPMAAAAAREGLPWRFVYGGRSTTTMAFLAELTAVGADRVDAVPHDTHGLPDLEGALRTAPAGTAVYCCGPEPLISAVERLMPAACPAGRLQVERFGAPTGGAQPAPGEAASFEVELRRSGQVITVPPGRSLLDAIRDVVPDAAGSCAEGVCGSCAVRVLGGTPDHRDHVLSGEQRARGDVIQPCVSRARTDRLTLDL